MELNKYQRVVDRLKDELIVKLEEGLNYYVHTFSEYIKSFPPLIESEVNQIIRRYNQDIQDLKKAINKLEE